MGGGRIYTDMVTIGDISVFDVVADPNGVITATQGSLASLRVGAASTVYINMDGAVLWRDLSASTTTAIPVSQLTAGENLVAGELVAVALTTSTVWRAISTTATGLFDLIGVVQDASILVGALGNVYTFDGSLIPVLFDAIPLAADNGRQVYISTTLGRATLTPPGIGNGVVSVGVLYGANGVTISPTVLLRSNFIVES